MTPIAIRKKLNNVPTILIIDDEKEVLVVLSFYLTRGGFHVVCATGGSEGLKIIKENTPDMVLLDLAMPDMNGIDVLKELKKSHIHIPVMMITGYRDGEKVVECIHLGAFDFLFKPFDFDYMIASIHKELKR